MKSIKTGYRVAIICLVLIFCQSAAYGWYDKTHLAIAKSTGYERWYHAVGADIAKLKAGNTEAFNHIYHNNKNQHITADLVLNQAVRYNNPHDPEGHLYGAIIASVREYRTSTLARKYAEYHIAYCVHYVGDLSQPLHNMPNDEFNVKHHNKNDGIVDAEVLENLAEIKKYTYPVTLRPENFENDLACEIARIANFSRYLGLRLKRENRTLTRDEAYRQLGHSSSLLQAILHHLGKIP
jgi:hypothetical protein